MTESRFSPPHGPPAWQWREPAAIRNVLLEGARKWGLESPLEISRIFSGWREMVGDQVAARCEPAALGKGVLKVWAASPPWANELRYLAPEVIRRVNAGVGRPVVRELKVCLRPAGRTPKGPAGRSTRSRGFVEEEEGFGSPVTATMAAPADRPPPDLADVEAMVAGIGDEKLAAATKRAVLAAKTHFRPTREEQ